MSSAATPFRPQEISVLVVDDEANHAAVTAETLERVGYDVTVATSAENGRLTLKARHFDILITDLVMKPFGGLELLKDARACTPPTEVVMISGHGGVDQAVSAIKAGAASFLTKPLDVTALREQVLTLVRKIRGEGESGSVEDSQPSPIANASSDFPEFVGRSAAMEKVFEIIRKVAPTNATVLITGSNGTGKEMVARAIHRLSPRAERPLVALNCGAMTESLLESELFGHVKGAFTGAVTNREGRVEYADKGTLFLDEIGDMSLNLQVKLLRVVQEREIVPVGSNEPVLVDVRIIAATNKVLGDEVQRGTFREDLYYRLKVVHIHMPELKEHREDIHEMVSRFIADSNKSFGRSIQGIDDAALRHLENYDWPGNVRQLKNCIENMCVLTSNEVLQVEDIPNDIHGTPTTGTSLAPLAAFGGLPLSGIEEFMIRHHIERLEGNRAKVAAALGISERTLYRKLREYGINA